MARIEIHGSSIAAYAKDRSMTRQSVYVTAAEWRWVIALACGMVLLAFLPLLWVALRGTPNWQFMGILHNYLDGATYLSKMALGQSGAFLVEFLHTPQPHAGAFIQALYLLLGHMSRLTGIPIIVLFHVARVIAALLMYAAIYQLAAVIWARVRARRVFFAVASIGSGLGWLFAPLTQITDFPDFPLLPEAFPFFSSLMNVHFPLTIACLALLASYFIVLFRPGAQDEPLIQHGFPLAALLGIALALLYPQALVPFIAAVCVFVATIYIQQRRLSPSIVRWTLALILPVVPFAFYYAFVVGYNPAMALWNQQNLTPSPPPHILAIGFGLPLLVGLPAIWRAARRFERDGDRFMLLWLVAMLVLIYLPTNIQRRFAVGMMIPVAYFAARAVEDVWVRYLNRRIHRLVGVASLFLISISSLVMLVLPALPAVAGDAGRSLGVFIQSDYIPAFNWVNERSSTNDVILASPSVSVWLPGWAGARAVYGHPYETLNAELRQEQVEAWYKGTADCQMLLTSLNVRFILVGPNERALTADGTSCADQLQLPVLAESGSVTIYAP
jgi:hypothetical protein